MGAIERLDARIDAALEAELNKGGWDNHPEANRFRIAGMREFIKFDIGLLVTMAATTIHPAGIILGVEPIRQGALSVVDAYRALRSLLKEQSS